MSVHWVCLPTMVENLQQMKYVLPAYEDGATTTASASTA